MEKEQKLSLIFDSLADELNITETMLKKAKTAYNALGDYIKSANDEWDVIVYPQGSFELGTVIKPLNDQEQYDVDLVVLVKSPSFDAKNLRNEVRKLLENHGRYEGKIEDKKPCIRIQYSDSAQFHMDIASAHEVYYQDDSIQIARFDGASDYYFDISNPKGYVKWFKKVMQYDKIQKERRVLNERAQTEVEQLELSKMRTPLQKAIQILKRHRDIYFTCRENSDDRPSSIIITTLCAMAYEDTMGRYDKDNTYLTIVNMLNQFQHYLKKNNNDEYYLENPSNRKENFLKKWNDNQNLVDAFVDWVAKAHQDIILNPEQFIENDPKELRAVLLGAFGQTEAEQALSKYGSKIGSLALSGKLLYDQKNAGIIISDQEGRAYKKHTYFGGECK